MHNGIKGGQASAINNIHKKGLNGIIGMMPKGYFVAGTLFRLSILTILFPFASLFIIDSLYTMLRSSAIVPQLFNLMLSPIQLAQPVPVSGAANPAWAIFGILGLLIAVSFLIGYRQVVKRELV